MPGPETIIAGIAKDFAKAVYDEVVGALRGMAEPSQSESGTKKDSDETANPLLAHLSGTPYGQRMRVEWKSRLTFDTVDGSFSGVHSDSGRHWLLLSVTDSQPLQAIPFDWIAKVLREV